MFDFNSNQQVRQRLRERLRHYFASVPGSSPEEFLLTAVQKEIDLRESALGQRRDPAFHPLPKETLPTEAVHGWLWQRLAAVGRERGERHVHYSN